MRTFFKSALLLLTIFLLGACGKTDQRGGEVHQVNDQNEIIMSDGSNIKGIYHADLMPVNHNLHFMKVGSAAIQRDGDTFSASVRLKYGPKDVTHKQAVYTGRRCPNLTDDTNNDAYIDINEAQAALGKITIPLDGSLDSQSDGAHQLPRGDNLKGSYFYKQTASFQRMFSDLKAQDTNQSDNIIKLKEHEGLTFPGRIVVIHGLSRKIKLPNSATALAGEDVYESIPVACGVLWKVPTLPEDLKE